MLVHEDRTGDLYSFTGTTGIPEVLTAVAGYNDANVDYAMGIDLDNTFGSPNDQGYLIKAVSRDGDEKDDNDESSVLYNRGIYFNITDRKGKAIAKAAIKTMKEVNGTGTDIRDYNVRRYNCNVKAQEWISKAGIDVDSKNHWFPNNSYTQTEEDILKKDIYDKWNPESGDLYDVWMKVGKNISVSKKQERCPLSE